MSGALCRRTTTGKVRGTVALGTAGLGGTAGPGPMCHPSAGCSTRRRSCSSSVRSKACCCRPCVQSCTSARACPAPPPRPVQVWDLHPAPSTSPSSRSWGAWPLCSPWVVPTPLLSRQQEGRGGPAGGQQGWAGPSAAPGTELWPSTGAQTLLVPGCFPSPPVRDVGTSSALPPDTSVARRMEGECQSLPTRVPWGC